MENKKHIIAVTALVKNQAGTKVLIVKRNKDEIAYPGKWAFPGGKLERGETIMQALKREVLEEVGLEIEDWKKFVKDYTFIRPDDHNVVGVTFLVKAKHNKVKLDSDFDDYAWVDMETIMDYDYITGMEEEIELAFREQ